MLAVRTLVAPLLITLALFRHGDATAAAFAIVENSASGQGMAFAGGGAIAEDASAVWFNPAGIVRLDDQYQLTASYIHPSFTYSDRGSVQETPLGNFPLLPGSEANLDNDIEDVVPTFFAVHALTDDVYLGLGINAPFGLTSKYDRTWIGRYQAVKSALKTVNVNPVVAWQPTPNWSIGGGISINYIDVELSNALDFATVCAAAIVAICPNGALPGQGGFDGFVRNKGDDVSLGANIGLMWFSDVTRVSLSWRSEIKHQLKGDATFTQPTTLGGFAALPEPLGSELGATFTDTSISADVTLPDSVSFAVFHQLTSDWSITTDITWTDWADIQAIEIEFDNPLTPTGVEALGFSSSWRYALGVQYRANQQWTLRTGAAFDESPTPNAQLRSARFPDADRTWLSLGFSYQVNRRYSVDFGYSHLLVDDVDINRLGGTENLLLGQYQSSVNIVSLQLTGKF